MNGQTNKSLEYIYKQANIMHSFLDLNYLEIIENIPLRLLYYVMFLEIVHHLFVEYCIFNQIWKLICTLLDALPNSPPLKDYILIGNAKTLI